ncbi:MAG: MBL fold metallo-hydrolase, partial [Planctomycetota bacterium]
MAATIEHLGHAAFRLSDGDKVVYVDPYEIADKPGDATAVLVTHEHFDHCSAEDVAKVAGPETAILGPADCRAKLEGTGKEFV